MWIDLATFQSVVAHTTLVSIDLVVERSDGKILLGQRKNRPAKGYWFVPGGRVLKGESLDNAFERLCKTELDHKFKRKAARFMGVYEHFYDDSFFSEGEDFPSTHYVVLGYHLRLKTESELILPDCQHHAFRWLSPAEIRHDQSVHEYSRAYLQDL